MKLVIMRRVDLVLGTLLCSICSLLHRFTHGPYEKGEPIQAPKKILFMKFLGIGSVVLAMPAIEEVRQIYPKADILFLTFRGNAGILKYGGLTDRSKILTIRDTHPILFVWDILNTVWKLRKEHIDVIIDLEFFSRFSAIMSFLIGSHHKVGFYNEHTPGLYRGNFLTHRVFYNAHQHTAQAFMDLVAAIKIGDEIPYCKIQYSDVPVLLKAPSPSDDQRSALLRKFSLDPERPLVLFNPNCTLLVLQRRWPLKYFAELIKKMLHDIPQVQLAVVGAASEKEQVDELMTLVHDERVRNLAGETNLDELITLMEMSRLFITNDSGPAHIAALTHTKILVLFGPETPITYKPLTDNLEVFYLGLGCSPCVTVFNGKLTNCGDNQCMKKITPDLIYSRVQDALL